MTAKAWSICLTLVWIFGIGCAGNSRTLKPEAALEAECPARARHVTNPDTFLVVGHRGAAAKSVENTLESLDTAITDGANALEIDISMTKDGEVVLWHDWDPDDSIAIGRQKGLESGVRYRPRSPAVGNEFRRPVDKLTLDELRAHYGYANKDGGEPVAAEIPTFVQFVGWAAKQRSLRYVLLDVKIPKTKPEFAEPLFAKTNAALTAANASFRWVYSTPHFAVWQRLSPLVPGKGLSLEIDPGVVLAEHEESCRPSSSTRAEERHGGIASSVHPGGWAQQEWKKLTHLLNCDLAARDRNGQANGQRHVEKVFAGTINDRKKIECLIDFGVDGLVTDEPALLHTIALERGRRVTKSDVASLRSP